MRRLSPVGRPKMDEREKKNVRLEIRLTQDENEILVNLTKKYSMSKTDVILKALRNLEKTV